MGCKWLMLLLLLLLFCSSSSASVTYDHKALVINGQRRILISGSIHYPRSTPEMWPDLIQKAKDGGLDVIQTYVFWNGHEPSPGQYYFEGRYDLVRFIKLVKQAGLYVHLRIGPYVCAEWNFGGFPVWLKFVPGISFRTDNEPFKIAMKGFTEKIVNMMKAEKLFEPQGGPIILSQIENEYGPVEYQLHAPGQAYTQWFSKMAVGLGTGVPWVACKQDDAPDPIISTCNNFYCDWFKANKPNKPMMWTENWTGWFTGFGIPVPHRPAEDMAYGVAKFIVKGGSFMNYYMYHGGTNFGRTAGAFIATSYDYDSPLDEYGLLREPKWGHLKELHAAIKLCEPALVSSEPTVTRLGSRGHAHVFKYQAGGCAAFLANDDPVSSAKMTFRGMNYTLPPWSVSILPDCKNTVLNTALVNSQSSQMKYKPVWQWFPWKSYTEEAVPYSDNSAIKGGLMEQINVTRDTTDYLWYSTDVIIDSAEAFLENGKYPQLTVQSAGHALHVFINGQFSGTAYGGVNNPKFTFTGIVKLIAGVNRISLLSVSVGLPNVGLHFETWNAGVFLGAVVLDGLNEGKRVLTGQKWSYKIGVQGEDLGLPTLKGSSSVQWADGASKRMPLTWYKTTFSAIPGNDPLALDMGTMGKGQVWINGQNIGRYWSTYIAKGDCSECDYAGTYREAKCQSNCGEPSQLWYHVPRSWLNPTENLLVVFEETGGSPSEISLVKRIVGSVCADINDWQPYLESYLMQASRKIKQALRPKANLKCAPGQRISTIKFASYGTPQGGCGSYKQGACHAQKSYEIFQKRCIGHESCSVDVAPEVYGGDPCPELQKKLSVEAICT